MFIDSDLSKTNKQPNIVNKDPAFLADLAFSSLLTDIISTNFDHLYGLCIGSKSIRTILQKNMTPTSNKLEEIYLGL